MNTNLYNYGHISCRLVTYIALILYSTHVHIIINMFVYLRNLPDVFSQKCMFVRFSSCEEFTVLIMLSIITIF